MVIVMSGSGATVAADNHLLTLPGLLLHWAPAIAARYSQQLWADSPILAMKYANVPLNKSTVGVCGGGGGGGGGGCPRHRHRPASASTYAPHNWL